MLIISIYKFNNLIKNLHNKNKKNKKNKKKMKKIYKIKKIKKIKKMKKMKKMIQISVVIKELKMRQNHKKVKMKLRMMNKYIYFIISGGK